MLLAIGAAPTVASAASATRAAATPAAGVAAAAGTGYYVTFVAEWCPDYSDIFANRARNDIVESLQDLGPDTQYGNSGRLINPVDEGLAPQDVCKPITGWEFTLGTGYQTRAVTGVWGSLSKVTGAYDTSIVTRNSTPLLDEDARPVTGQSLTGATTIELSADQVRQAAQGSSLWAQGGTPSDPVLAQKFPGPQYGFGTLRCATDNLNGDNVEYIFFPQGVRHVFCYGLYVKPPPTTGIITIKKVVSGAPAGTNAAFPFSGTLSFNPDGFQLTDGASQDFYRAGGDTWTVTEGAVDGYTLASVHCETTVAGGGSGQSTVDTTGPTVSIHLVALEHVTCVYTNRYVPPPGGLTIRKLTTGGVGRFAYIVTPSAHVQEPHRASATTTRPGVPVDAEPSMTRLAPGSYTIRERAPSAGTGTWRLRSVNCNGVSHSPSRPVTVTISSGASVTCLFVNAFTPSGSITVAKLTHGATGTAGFLISPLTGTPAQYLQRATTTTEGVAADALPDTPADATGQLPLGSYEIVEQPPLSSEGTWTLTEITCNGVTVPFDQGTVVVTLTKAQPAVRCLYTDAFSAAPPPEPPIEPPGPEVDPDQPSEASADIAVSKHASTSIIAAGQIVTYSITVANHGPDDAENVVLTDQPPAHATVVAVHTATGTCAKGAPIICELGTMKPRARVRISVLLALLTPQPALTNRAVVGTATNDPQLANNVALATVRVVAPPPPIGRG